MRNCPNGFHFAQNISEKFMRLGKNTICPLTISSQDNIISQIHSDDLANIISFSNNNFQINRIKNILRKVGKGRNIWQKEEEKRRSNKLI